MRRTLVALSALLAFPASAHAGWFPSEQIDGPSGDIVRVGDVDLGNDGTGAVVYVKREGGVEHVFASRLTTGAFEGVERLDTGLNGASSQPVVAAGSEGRMVAAWVNDGNLFTSVRPKGATAWTAPGQLVAGGVSNPAIDMSVNGITYVTFTQGGDVKAARAARDQANFTVLPEPLDADRAREAGTGDTRRSRVAVSAEGIAVATWGEDHADGRTHVHARRIFEQRVSVIHRDLTLDSLDGVPATSAEVPNLDVEFDSSYAQVVFRQNTANGPRVVMRRLVGSDFEPHEVVDSGASGVNGTVDLTGRGEGMIGVQVGSGEVFASTLFDNKLTFRSRFDSAGGTVAPGPIATVGENEDGALSWMSGDGQVRGRFLDNIEKPQIEPEAGLLNPAFGTADVNAGLDAAATRTGDTAVAFVQVNGGERRLVGAYYDKPPSRPVPNVSVRPRRLVEMKFAAGLNLLGPTTYRVLIDGRSVGETQTPGEITLDPEAVPEGRHRLQIQAVDRRGQASVSRTRTALIDNTPPTLRAGIMKRGRSVVVTGRAADRRGRLKSGLLKIEASFGNGAKRRVRGRTTYTYPRSGTYTVTVTAYDKAGNPRNVSKRIRIG